ncbi:MAG: hypothetical protein A2015_02500 [Spirochaetes bacterium GWF1_31_7]|nr:MAG: hypothetical protein A2Y30_04930 [Spirochaetes bacterium GWE1_32_154]OHD52896.1 MAG: hypothetical protein A2Y29_10640 [Spirochaetes bacterium GWE2_31_10]OHD53149.1 MAG: hypothetical protein A2015_02500 [Spirochaetes bacterium GWF1_31_7]HBD93570.1 hypothetical protein [Spirochaetia bacterium]HBI38303.1 hypothetical protein [Spirochaetia bacterium]
MEAILLYIAEPSTVVSLCRVVNVIRESGYQVYGIFQNIEKLNEDVLHLFDEYTIVNKLSFDKTIIRYREVGIRMVLVADADSKYYYEKLLFNFNVVTLIGDLRYNMNLLQKIKHTIHKKNENIINPIMRDRYHIRKDINESDLILSFANTLFSRTVRKRYRGQLSCVHYFSEDRDRYIPSERKSKLLIYIPAVYSNCHIVRKFINYLNEFKEKISIIIDDRTYHSNRLRNYISLKSKNNYVAFQNNLVPVDDYIKQSDLVFIPDREGYCYINEIVDSIAYGRVLIGLKKSIINDFAPDKEYSFILDELNYDCISLMISRVLLNTYLLNTMGENCYNLYKVKYVKADFINELKKIINEYNV